MDRPNDIPQDVMVAAQRTLDSERKYTAFLNSAERERVVEAIARAILAERERCVKVAENELRNTAMLMSNPPKSSAAWDIRNAILSGDPA